MWMLGLSSPQAALVQVIAEAAPKQTGIDKIERVLAELQSRPARKRPDHSLSDRLRFLDLCLRQLIGWIVYGQQIGVDP